MAPKTKDPTTKNSKDAQKRTQVKDLPQPEEKLDQKEMKKVRGGMIEPCYRKRR